MKDIEMDLENIEKDDEDNEVNYGSDKEHMCLWKIV